ncbi:hypothetical protein CGRA01v4_05591 [Colletotrichum graminicola]|uniref:TAFII55 protein conserved region domain-containing protein n=1 Tax=Colletotrichum graminicola (strain M1.001 / M2 / FGSC 10212) TaxID=645133 RepID=E3Q6J5_COLGM|nr:uncharacterized protein GLRG_01587 [Colletotrichum graminicola M1.001]EFQ26443.1 hypothetical protein GLRG_01587 [Colletotrichum graminicola M1.001]WDK14309.1 hypothetical protein CGRA01v4_05591 [Colletotrichum graminicola]
MPEISAPPPRPKLKLSVGSRQPSFSEQNGATPSASTPSSSMKIKLKSSQPPTPAGPAAPTPSKTKAGRQPKPTSKLIESKKREQDDDDDNGGGSQPSKKIKLLKTPTASTPRTGHIVVKSKGKPPVHPPGDGYDSEASDQEKDPTIEEQFILRMMPGEHCEYVRKCIEEGKVGVPRKDGGADILMKFFEEETRRAMVVVKGQPYAAVMVELPTITEGMKSWDRKTLMKSADICHMLLVFQQVRSEEEAKKAPLPAIIQHGFKWPHGLTPPMHDATNQRFAKIISRSEIELKENEVKKLLQADAAALSSKYELVDDRKMQSGDEYSDDEQDADGEADDSGYFPADGYNDGELDEHDDDLEAELMAAFEEEAMNQATTEVGTPATQLEAATPMTMNTGTPAHNAQDSGDGEGSVASEEDEDDDDDDDDDDKERLDEVKAVREDIAQLKNEIAKKEQEKSSQTNKILRNRVEARLKDLRAELSLKQASIGEQEEDED